MHSLKANTEKASTCSLVLHCSGALERIHKFRSPDTVLLVWNTMHFSKSHFVVLCKIVYIFFYFHSGVYAVLKKINK